MNIKRLKEIEKEAVKLHEAGKHEEANRVSEIAKAYARGEEMGVISASLVGVADGITAQWGDELGGAANALIRIANGDSPKENYKKGRDFFRKYQEEASLTSPYAHGIGEVVGAGATMGVGPGWLRAGEKGVEAVRGMKMAKGALPYLKATAKAVNTFGKPGLKFGAIVGAGRARDNNDMIPDIASGAAGGYLTSGLLGTTLGNLFFKKGVEGAVTPLTKAEVLNRAKETFEPDFVNEHQDNLMNLHDLIKKHGFKGKGIGEALEEAESTGESLDKKLTSFMSNVSKYYKLHEQKGYVPKQDPTELSAREILDSFKGSLKDLDKRPYSHGSERAKIEKILTGFEDTEDDFAVRTLKDAEAKWRRTGIQEDPLRPPEAETPGQYAKVKYGGDTLGDPITGENAQQSITKGIYTPGDRPTGEDILDKKIFNIKGQRELLKYVNRLIEEGDRSKHDPEVATKFAAHMRNLYQKNLNKSEPMMQYGKDWEVTPETPNEMHELIQLKDAFKSGASKTLNDEAAALAAKKQGVLKKIGGLFVDTRGPIGKTRTVINAADKLLLKDKPPSGLLEITSQDMNNLSDLPKNIADDMASRYQAQGLKESMKKIREYPATTGKIGESIFNIYNPSLKVPTPTTQEKKKEDEEQQLIKKYQEREDESHLEDSPFDTTAPSSEDRMKYKQSEIKKEPEKLLMAIRKAREKGEFLSPLDPNFKKKVRKYLVDNKYDLA